MPPASRSTPLLESVPGNWPVSIASRSRRIDRRPSRRITMPPATEVAKISSSAHPIPIS
jgi:hypothetical protein